MLEHTPLETLPPTVERAVGAAAPAPVRMMAAKGLAPLVPGDLLLALYQLSFSEDVPIREAAFNTAIGLPDKIFTVALTAPLDGRVLDFFALRVFQKPKLLELVLLNRAVLDETYAHLATLCGEDELEMIAKNEERMLRHPAIIAALYMNPKTRMSTAQRALELAIRNGIEVKGVPAFEEAAQAIAEAGTPTPSDDAAFAAAAAEVVDTGGGLLPPEDPREAAALLEEELDEAEKAATATDTLDGEKAKVVEKKKLKISELSPAGKVRLATLGNSFARAVLIRDKNKQVSMAAIRSPAITDPEVSRYAADRSLDAQVIGYITRQRAWMKNYAVKLALINNPKCSLETSMHLLPHLNPKDLKILSRSKGVAAVLTTAAKRLVRERQSGGGGEGEK